MFKDGRQISDQQHSLRIIYVYIKEARDKINIQNPTISLYISNKQVKHKVKNTLPFVLATSKMKYI